MSALQTVKEVAAPALSVASQLGSMVLIAAAMQKAHKEPGGLAQKPKALLSVTLASLTLMLILEAAYYFGKIPNDSVMVGISVGMDMLRFLALTLLVIATVETEPGAGRNMLWAAVAILGVDTVTTKMRMGMQICDLWYESRSA